MTIPVWLLGLKLLLSSANLAAATPRCARPTENPPSGKVQAGLYVFHAQKSMLGHPINRYEAYFQVDEGWRRIPLQIDEVNSAGEYVLPNGLPYTANTDDGILDANDELVIPTKTSVGKTVSEIPAGRRAQRIYICSRGNVIRRALLVVKKDPVAPLWDPARASFQRSQATVQSTRYRYKLRRDHPVLLGDVAVRNTKAKSYEALIKRGSFLIDLVLPWFLPNFRLQENDFRSEIECWKNGVLRSIVAVGIKYRSFLGLFNFHFFSELVFSNSGFSIPTIIEFPFSPRHFLSPGSGMVFAVQFEQPESWTITSDLKPLPQQSPKKVSQVRQNMTADSDSHRYVFTAKNAAANSMVLVNLDVDQRALKTVPPPFLFSPQTAELKAANRHWDWISAIGPSWGIFVDISTVEKGSYSFSLDLTLSSAAEQEQSVESPVYFDWELVY